MIVVDTSVWIDFFNQINNHQSLLLQNLLIEEEEIYLTELIIAEVLQGIKSEEFFKKIKDNLLLFPVLFPQPVTTYIHASQIYRICRKNGHTIRKTIDCVIASICIENHATLLHKDSDFDQIALCTNLKIY